MAVLTIPDPGTRPQTRPSHEIFGDPRLAKMHNRRATETVMPLPGHEILVTIQVGVMPMTGLVMDLGTIGAIHLARAMIGATVKIGRINMTKLSGVLVEATLLLPIHKLGTARILQAGVLMSLPTIPAVKIGAGIILDKIPAGPAATIPIMASRPTGKTTTVTTTQEIGTAIRKSRATRAQMIGTVAKTTVAARAQNFGVKTPIVAIQLQPIPVGKRNLSQPWGARLRKQNQRRRSMQAGSPSPHRLSSPNPNHH